MFVGTVKNTALIIVSAFVRERPDLYRKMLLRRLIPLHKQVKGFILTFDWSPVMRMIVEVCRDLDIPTILIPHESVFIDKEKYYWDLTAHASVPQADIVLGWGYTQRDIFKKRGYPVEQRFEIVGAPKFDMYFDFEPHLTRKQFCKVFGLDSNLKFALFAAQPLDSQLNQIIAREAQRNSLIDLHQKCLETGVQLLIRMPPSQEEILGEKLRQMFTEGGVTVIDEAQNYFVTPDEVLYHSDVVVSINSTMLFEGVLLGRPAISMKYMDFDQIWDPIRFPIARNAGELSVAMDLALGGGWQPDPDGMVWAARSFGVGTFDGQAAQRIRRKLISWAGETRVSISPSPLQKLFAGDPLDVVAISSSKVVIDGPQKYLKNLVAAQTLLTSRPDQTALKNLASTDIFLQWGSTTSKAKVAQADVAHALGRPVVYVEDGFIRSVALGLSGTPTLSIIMDDSALHYDATRVSRLENLLQDGPELTREQHKRARLVIKQIVARRISKYNQAPDARLAIGESGRPKLLLVDQRFGDQSVVSGLASEASFDSMLFDAIHERPDHDIIIKQHPDAISGGKLSYFTPERLAKIANLTPRLFPVAYEINPFALLDLAEEVWVGTSGMGFEALMAGCKVRCYGVPFYSGWGLTDDRQVMQRRNRTRSIEDLFYFAWIRLSRYVDPVSQNACEIEAVIEYICSERGW